MNQDKVFGFSSFQLKVIAMITMVIDHIGLLFLPECTPLRVVGRISFPIFAFLIVEGFFHTSNVRKYMGRLLIFALLSEIPFDLMAKGRIVDLTYQNVFFTLLVGLVMIYGMHRSVNPMMKNIWLVVALAGVMVLRTDYSVYGIVIIYLFYYFRDIRKWACVGLAVSSLFSSMIQTAAVLSIPFIMMYNGKKGPDFVDKKWMKYAFYGFYPIHMIILVMIKKA